MARVHPGLEGALPRLHTLNFDIREIGYFRLVRVLLQQSLRRLRLHFDSDLERDLDDYKDIFQLIANQSPLLEQLSLSFRKRIIGIEERVQSIWHRLPNLLEVSFPHSLTSIKFMYRFAKFPRLRGIHALERPRLHYIARILPFDQSPNSDFTEGILSLNPEVDYFPSVTRFTINLYIGIAAKILAGPTSPRNLTSLRLTSCLPRGEVTFSWCMSTLADNCHALESLLLIFRNTDTRTDYQEHITYREFKSVLLFRKLVDFAIDFPGGVTEFLLSDADLDDLSMNWPSLKLFHFSYFHPFKFRPILSLKCLISFAINCPKLETLAIPIKSIVESPNNLIPVVFRNLNELCLNGDVFCPDPDLVAIFLSGILRPSCSFIPIAGGTAKKTVLGHKSTVLPNNATKS